MTAQAEQIRMPWRRMWLHPRVTVRGLLERASLGGVLLLAAGSGVVQSLVQASSNQVGNRVSGVIILGAALLVGAAWGLLQLHLITGLLFLVGKWTGAPARFSDTRAALAWAAVPQTAILPFWIIGTLLFGRFLFADPRIAMANLPLAVLAQALLMLATLMCATWWIVLQVLVVAEVQHISAWRALGHFLVAGFMVGVAALLVVGLFIVA